MEIITEGEVSEVQYENMLSFLDERIDSLQSSKAETQARKAEAQAQLNDQFPMGQPAEDSPEFPVWEDLTNTVSALEAKIESITIALAKDQQQKKDLQGAAQEGGTLTIVPGNPDSMLQQIGVATGEFRNRIVTEARRDLEEREMDIASNQDEIFRSSTEQATEEIDTILADMDEKIESVQASKTAAFTQVLDGLFADGEGGLSERMDKADINEEVIEKLHQIVSSNEETADVLVGEDVFKSLNDLRSTYGEICDPLSEKANAIVKNFEYKQDNLANATAHLLSEVDGLETHIEAAMSTGEKATDVSGLENITLTKAEYDLAKENIHTEHNDGNITDREKATQLIDLEIKYQDLDEDGSLGNSAIEITRLNGVYSEVKDIEGRVVRSVNRLRVLEKEYVDDLSDFEDADTRLKTFKTETLSTQASTETEKTALLRDEDKRKAEYEKAKVESEEEIALLKDAEKAAADSYNDETDAGLKGDKAQILVDAKSNLLMAELVNHNLDLNDKIATGFFNASLSRLEAQEQEIIQALDIISSAESLRDTLKEGLDQLPITVLEAIAAIDMTEIDLIESNWALGSTPPEGEDAGPYTPAHAEYHDKFFAVIHGPGFYKESTLNAKGDVQSIWSGGAA
ncbi:MAG: hypothetical protein CMC82_03565 [Flavobacteriaceae bacterium]|nr:hypothetical protein [Flavobacteriaceae bacterium]